MSLVIGIHRVPKSARAQWGFYRWNVYENRDCIGVGLNLGWIGLHAAWVMISGSD